MKEDFYLAMDAYSLFHFDSNRKINRKAGCKVKQIVQKEANQKASPPRAVTCRRLWRMQAGEGPMRHRAQQAAAQMRDNAELRG